MSSQATACAQRILDLVSEYHDAAFAARPFVPGETPGACFRDGVRCGRYAVAGRFVARFLADHRPLRRAVRKAVRALVRHPHRDAGQLRLVRRPAGRYALDLAETRRPAAEARRRSDHGGRRVSHDRQSDHPERAGPVFVDEQIPTYNIDVSKLEEARSERTRAVMIAHTLGNPFDLGAVTEFAKKHDLWLVEDCCDAVGATYNGQKVGTFGDLATVSFYPAHHITMGEGGACSPTSRF